MVNNIITNKVIHDSKGENKMSNNFEVEIIKYPTDDDWMLCKKCTLNTVGKNTTKLPTEEWKHKLLMSEHSPIRTLNFCIKMTIPYYVSVH